VSGDMPRSPHRQSMRARSLVGLPELPTIVAVGPFDDIGHAEQLGAAFNSVQSSAGVASVTGSKTGPPLRIGILDRVERGGTDDHLAGHAAH
jgi:hypothetical protein